MAERKYAEKQTPRETVTESEVIEVAERDGDATEALSEADAVLDDIDEILEDASSSRMAMANALNDELLDDIDAVLMDPEIALNYVQTNGQ